MTMIQDAELIECTDIEPILTRKPTAISLLADAKNVLAKAKTLGEAKYYRDEFEAIRAFASQRIGYFDIQQQAAEGKVRAERRMGEMLREMPKNTGGRPSENQSHDVTSLKDIGIEKMQSHRWQLMASLPDGLFESHLDNAKEKGKEITSAGILSAAKSHKNQSTNDAIVSESKSVDNLNGLVESGEKFSCIYADPPWQYGNQATRASTDNHYPTMPIDDIVNLPIKELAADDAHLHLWTTNAFLFEAKRVMESWGFTYKSVFVWVKPQMGIGNYWRVSHEFMLFGIRGSCKFRNHAQMSWMEADRTKHSAKPDEVRTKIELVSPGPYLELFGRKAVKGWTVWGNQVMKEDDESIFPPSEAA